LSIPVILLQFFILFLGAKKIGAAISSLVLKKQAYTPAQHYPHWPWQRAVPGKAMRKKINAPQKQVYKHVGSERLFEMSTLTGNVPQLLVFVVFHNRLFCLYVILQVIVDGVLPAVGTPTHKHTQENEARGGWRNRRLYQAIVRIVVPKHLLATQHIGNA
jgi:hypothetical protein